MKNLTLALITLLTIALTSCNKDNSVAQKLEGNWELTKSSVNGIETPLGDFKNTGRFYNIKENQGKYETSTFQKSNDSLIISLIYDFEIKNNGSTLYLEDELTNTPSEGTIDELSSNKLILSSMVNGLKSTTELTKK